MPHPAGPTSDPPEGVPFQPSLGGPLWVVIDTSYARAADEHLLLDRRGPRPERDYVGLPSESYGCFGDRLGRLAIDPPHDHWWEFEGCEELQQGVAECASIIDDVVLPKFHSLDAVEWAAWVEQRSLLLDAIEPWQCSLPRCSL